MVVLRPNWPFFSKQLREKQAHPEDEFVWREYAVSRARLIKAKILTEQRTNAWGFRFDVTGKSEGIAGLYFVRREDAVAFGNIHFGHGDLWEPTFFGDSMLGYGQTPAIAAEPLT